MKKPESYISFWRGWGGVGPFYIVLIIKSNPIPLWFTDINTTTSHSVTRKQIILSTLTTPDCKSCWGHIILFLTVTSGSRPMLFTSMRAVTSHIVTHVICFTLTTRVVTSATIVVWRAYWNIKVIYIGSNYDFFRFKFFK